MRLMKVLMLALEDKKSGARESVYDIACQFGKRDELTPADFMLIREMTINDLVTNIVYK